MTTLVATHDATAGVPPSLADHADSTSVPLHYFEHDALLDADERLWLDADVTPSLESGRAPG